MALRIAFIGLGVMGYPMAGHLVRADHNVTVFNRTRERAERWVAEHGGRLAESPAAAHTVRQRPTPISVAASSSKDGG